MPLCTQPFLPPGELGRSEDDGLKVPASAFWMVCLTVFIDSLGGSISAPVLPFYAKAFDISNESVGILFSSFSIAQVIFLPIFGWLADHVGRRRVLILSLFGAALGAWAQGWATSFWLLVVGRIISGACGAVGSTANVYVSDITSEGVRGQYLGHIMSSNAAAFAFGPGLGGGLSRFGLNVPVEVQGVLCVVAGLLAFVYLPESPVFMRQQQTQAARDSVDPLQSCHISFSADVWTVCFVEFLRGISFSAIFALYGLFALEVYGLDSLHIGFVVCVGAIVFLCTNIWITCPLQRLLRQVPSASLGMVLMAVGELLLAFGPTLSFSLCGTWVVYMGQAIAGCTIAAITSTLSTDSNRGEVMSVQQMAQAVGRVVGPIALGYLSNKDLRLPFAAAASASLLAAALLASVGKAYRRKLVMQPDPSPAKTPPPGWIAEEYSDDDVDDLGRFLCELLTEGRYRWHEPKQREALKKALRICFPPLTSEDTSTGDAHTILTARSNPSMPAPLRACLAEANVTGDAVLQRTPIACTRRRKGSA